NHSLFLIALALTFLFLLIAVNEAKVFTKCELASILKGKGMDGYHGYSLGNWICMAYHESRYNSRAVGPRNSDGSRDYGIFQINSRYWCKNNQGPTANGCNKPCSAFTNDDIKDDIECAKRIVRDPQKMGAWVAWRNHCKGRDLSQWTRGCRL
uniref:Glycosyl hydrolases family 22 (GH22) domain-containing protein n=1 Tax=Naja naja TaxID=35670 RepID=A0A8C6X4T1_NAJNA